MSQDRMPLVSVIIPTHDRPVRLRRAIQSAIEQTYTNLEIIVIDDASESSPQNVISELDDRRISLLQLETNSGASAARNAGIARATGEYLAFLDDDDRWAPAKIQKQLALFQTSGPEVGMVYCWMEFVDGSGRQVGARRSELHGKVFDQVLGSQRLGGCPTLMVRASAAKQIGGFDESLRRGNDGDFIRRMCRDFEVDYVPEDLVTAEIDDGPRISMMTRAGISLELKAFEIWFHKFAVELEHNKKARAELLRSRARGEARLGQRRSALGSLLRAATYHPLTSLNLRCLARIVLVKELRD
ncbi:MAG: glycosyltransferase family 2 protein [Chloroflexi bacterium]|nr:glycosyltransferase family 2 protein [Chloroflexota bacterium]